MGCVLQGGLGQAPARQAALLAGTCPMFTLYLGKVNCLFTFLVNISCLFTIWKLDMCHVPNRPSTDNTMHHNQQSMRLWHESHHAKRC